MRRDLTAEEARLIKLMHSDTLDRCLQAAAWGGNSVLVRRLSEQQAKAITAAPAALWADAELLDALLECGGAVNLCGRDGLPTLHLLALAESEQEAVALAPRLAKLGADATDQHKSHGDAIEFALQLDRPVLAKQLRALKGVAKFRWQREARERGIVRIKFYYNKADGLCFAPGNPDRPLEVGGDYNGAYPTSAVGGLAEIEKTGLIRELHPQQQALIRKLARGEDFSIDEVLATVSESQVEYRRG